ncbi:hypothetical protein BDW66DRAFT_154205 [Aspergillus desertorum]
MSFTREDYTVAWICALPLEMTAAKAMLDTLHPPQPQAQSDQNTYILGSISGHNIVIACLPTGVYGVASATVVLAHTQLTFPSIRFGLMVGIGGGVPSESSDIRLGDVVVSVPTAGSGGVVQYDFGKTLARGVFERTGSLNKPPQNLLTAISQIRSDNMLRGSSTIGEVVAMILQRNETLRESFSRPDNDWLFTSKYDHQSESLDCSACDKSQLLDRAPRETDEPIVHYGLIASGNQVMKDARTRDYIAQELGILCFEMEAAGLMDQLPCLVVRGICDYCDSHKQKQWQGHAALTAAAYAKMLLQKVPPHGRRSGNIAETRSWMVPFARNTRFAGRQHEIDCLESLIIHSGGPAKIAIYGLGGIGKTQVALEIAYRTREQIPECSIFWIPCTSIETVDQAYMDIASNLRIMVVEPSKVKEQVKAYLSRPEAGRWLLIFDNADYMQMWTTGSAPLKDILPRSEHGQILFTTRNRKLALKLAPSKVLSIPDVDKNTAMKMLENLLIQECLLQDSTITFAFLEQLDFLPLALTQAAAYINENGIGLTEYLSLLKEEETTAVELLSEEFEDEGRYLETQNPVVTTWLISFQHIRELDSLAADYLSFIACISPKDIPHSILPPAPTAKKRVDALGLLDAYSFITRHACNSSFSLHRLVHLAMRNWLRNADLLGLWVQKTSHRLDDIFPSTDHENRELWRSYIPHALCLIENEEFRNICHDYIGLTLRVGESLRVDGRYRPAKDLFGDCLNAQEKTLGPHHLDTILSVSALGSVLHNLGEYSKAEAMYQRALEGYCRLLGPEHPNSLAIADNLAQALQYQGKYKEAEAMNRRALDGCTRLLGPVHPDSLNSLSILGSLLQYQGRYAEAEAIVRQALKGREKVLGPEHPHTLASAHDLALVFYHQGKYKEAEAITKRTLHSREKILGPEHPDTLACVSSLSSIFREQGQYEEAEALNRRSLEGYQRVLGSEHHNAVGSVSMLGSVLQYQGKYKEAETMFRQAVKGYKIALGPEHPDTLANLDNLALVLQCQGKYKEAEALNWQAVAGYKQVLGPEHPDTITSISMLGSVLFYQGKHKEAEEMLSQALRVREEVLGLEHPHTLTSADNFALVLHAQGKYEEAAVMNQRAFKGYKKALGSEHPDTLTSMHNLAYAWTSLGKAQEALALMAECVQLRKKVLGPDHPHVKISTEALGKWQQCNYSSPDEPLESSHAHDNLPLEESSATPWPAIAAIPQPREKESPLSYQENRAITLTRTYLGDHPLIRASSVTSTVAGRCDLDEVD